MLSALVGSNASLDGGRMQRRGRLGWRSDSGHSPVGAHYDAPFAMAPDRRTVSGARATVLCSVQRGAVVPRQRLLGAPTTHCSSLVIASRLTLKLSCKRSTHQVAHQSAGL